MKKRLEKKDKSDLLQFVLLTTIEKAFKDVGLSENSIAQLYHEVITNTGARDSDRLRVAESMIALLGPKAKKDIHVDIEGDLSSVLNKFEQRVKDE